MPASHPGRPPGWCNETNALHCCHVVDGIKGPLYHNGQNSKRKKKHFSQESLKVGRQGIWRYIKTLRAALVKMLKLHMGLLSKSIQYRVLLHQLWNQFLFFGSQMRAVGQTSPLCPSLAFLLVLTVYFLTQSPQKSVSVFFKLTSYHYIIVSEMLVTAFYESDKYKSVMIYHLRWFVIRFLASS